MANKYLEIQADGVMTEVEGTTTSAGAVDAGEIVALNSDGVLDETLMPPGIVPMLVDVVASQDLLAGQFVNIWNDGGVAKARRADATIVDTKADGYVREDFLTSEIAKVYVEDFNDQLVGLTPGANYFLSTTPGGVVTTPPSTANNIVQYLGKAVSATKMIVEIARPVKKA